MMDPSEIMLEKVDSHMQKREILLILYKSQFKMYERS